MQQCPVAGVTNYLKVGGLKQQIFILVQFWKPKDRNLGVSRATLPPKALRKTLPSFSELLVALSNHCFMAASPQSLPQSSQGVLQKKKIQPFFPPVRFLHVCTGLVTSDAPGPRMRGGSQTAGGSPAPSSSP